MIRGRGRDFTFRVARYMETCDVKKRDLRRFLVRARHFEHANLFFKVEFGTQGPREFSYYFRRRAKLEVVRAWLADSGVGDQGWYRAARCAEALGKKTAHFLAASVAPVPLVKDDPVLDSTEKVYFSQPADGEIWSRVLAAGQSWGLQNSAWNQLIAYRDALFAHGAFFSIQFRSGIEVPSIKLDVHRLSPTTISALAAGSAATVARFDLLRTLFGKEKPDYFGIRLGVRGPESTRMYCFDEPSSTAEDLRSMTTPGVTSPR
ncbi:MAG: hypothetical protein MJE77_32675 [Proteobacteria bacterium]|nr:hypothetical protein [Pseudomonadota bacterium]